MWQGGNHIVLRLGKHLLGAEALRGKRVLWSGASPWATTPELAEVVSALLASTGLGREFRSLEIVVEPPLVQFRRLTDIPPVSERVLKTIAHTQAARYFRRYGSPLVTDAVWTTVDGVRTAQLCAVEAPVLEALAGGAQAAGLQLTSVMPAGSARLSLMPPSTKEANAHRVRRSLNRWAVAASIAWALVGAVLLARLTLEHRRVDRELLRLEEPANALRVLRLEIRAAREMVDAVDAAERGGQGLSERLVDLVTALPDSAFLASLTLSATGNGAATGYARRASEVGASVERSAGVRAPRFEGRVTREIVLGREWERFTLAFGDSVKGAPRRAR